MADQEVTYYVDRPMDEILACSLPPKKAAAKVCN